MNYSDVKYTPLFSSFIFSLKPHISTEDLKREAYEIREEYESIGVSNSGGYHSPRFHNDMGKPYLTELGMFLQDISTKFLQDNNYQLEAKVSDWWVNINPQYAYNVLHSHHAKSLIAIYYIEAIDSKSELILLRNDGSTYTNLYANLPQQLKFSVPCETGVLYILPGHLQHYVTANPSDNERISVSFNIDCWDTSESGTEAVSSAS